jgi:hypothetical protein
MKRKIYCVLFLIRGFIHLDINWNYWSLLLNTFIPTQCHFNQLCRHFNKLSFWLLNFVFKQTNYSIVECWTIKCITILHFDQLVVWQPWSVIHYKIGWIPPINIVLQGIYQCWAILDFYDKPLVLVFFNKYFSSSFSFNSTLKWNLELDLKSNYSKINNLFGFGSKNQIEFRFRFGLK